MITCTRVGVLLIIRGVLESVLVVSVSGGEVNIWPVCAGLLEVFVKTKAEGI